MAEKIIIPQTINEIKRLISQGEYKYTLDDKKAEQFIGEVLIFYGLTQVSFHPPGHAHVSVKIGFDTANCRINFPPPIIGPHMSYLIKNKKNGILELSDIKIPILFEVVAGQLIDQMSDVNAWMTTALNYFGIPVTSLWAQINNKKINTELILR